MDQYIDGRCAADPECQRGDRGEGEAQEERLRQACGRSRPTR